MNEPIPGEMSPEEENFVSSFELHAKFKGSNGGDEVIGIFQLESDEKGQRVVFVPNSANKRPGSNTTILEATFSGTVRRIERKGDHYYNLEFPKETETLYPSLTIGFPRKFKDHQSRSINASLGRFSDEYSTWELSDEQWREIDEWLSRQKIEIIKIQ